MTTKQRKSITVREAQEALQQMNLSYGRGAQITVDEDFNFQLAESRDELAEESPEASLKRAERQEKNDGQPVDEPKSETNKVAVKEEKSAQALKDR